MTEELVVLRVADTAFEAKFIAGILLEDGVPARVEGGLLPQRFAPQPGANRPRGVQVRVPAHWVERAEAALAAAEAAGAQIRAVPPPRSADGDGESASRQAAGDP
ncbi:MAG: hypothetical protein AAF628_06850 [Planctomycetota bacterium]